MAQVTRSHYDQLVDSASKAARAYYESQELLMGDDEYDALVREISLIEAKHPSWGNFSNMVAGGVGGGEVTHSRPMLSLGNLFDESELEDWLSDIVATYGQVDFLVEPKFDGLAVAAKYENGILTCLATRGDGITGEDVTPNAANITGLPLKLKDNLSLEIRGEVYMTDKDFATANASREAAGEVPFANPRNATAGTLRLKYKRSYAAPMTFTAYDRDNGGNSLRASLLNLQKVGIRVYERSVKTKNAEKVVAAVKDILSNRHSLGFGVDGAVVKVDDRSIQEKLGANSRIPRWATAYKFPAELAMTKLIDIEVQLGRTGLQTPRAVLEPVEVGGVTVTYATLSNPGQVTAKDVRIGDTVFVRRAGDVIPEITGPNLALRPKGTRPWKAPTVCVNCGEPIDTSEARWRCLNRSCGLREQIVYWCGRDQMDLDGVGPGLIDRLLDANLLEDVADLYKLNEEQIAGLPGHGEKSAQIAVAAIEKSKAQPLHRVFCGLGIRLTGRSMSRRIAKHFGSMSAIRTASVEDFAAIDGVGPIRAASIVEELSEIGDLIDKLAELGVVAASGAAAASGGPVGASGGPVGPSSLPLAGKKVCVSGAVPGLNRNEANEAVESLGGTSVSSVSAKTDLLVSDPESGTSKVKNALKFGVEIMSPEDFVALLGQKS